MKDNTATSVRKIKGGVTLASGFKAGAVKGGIKASKGLDVALLMSDVPCSAAGTFTTNAVRASCVDWNERHLPAGDIRAVLCISGNANACTGEQGVRDTAEMAALAGAVAGSKAAMVLTASTGVIGHFMPMDKVRKGVAAVAATLDNGTKGGDLFSRSIMTTDLVKKEAAVRVTAGKKSYVIGGATKGSGMIHPNMATMLAFITSDVAIDPKLLRTTLRKVVDWTFNNLTVDGDTSTNDMVLVLANGMSGVTVKSPKDLAVFEKALFTVCNDLCAAIAADGEGATKRIEVDITGAKTYKDGKLAAKAIANSNLTKCAMFGNDPNWGRILCAIGYSGARFSKEKIVVSIGGIPVCKALRPQAFDMKKMQKALRSKVVVISADLGQGDACAVAHTCDLTYDYIKINADYHT